MKGFPSVSHYGGKAGALKSAEADSGKQEVINTVYFLTLDSINICFLGAVDTTELSAEITEALLDIVKEIDPHLKIKTVTKLAPTIPENDDLPF